MTLEERAEKIVAAAYGPEAVEKYIGGHPSHIAKFLRDHPEFVTDHRLNMKLCAFCMGWEFLDERDPNTPEFIEAVKEKFLGDRYGHEDKTTH